MISDDECTYASSDRLTCPQIDYNPSVFLRCHSRIKDDSADKRTGVWSCAFEPVGNGSFNKNNKYSVFASCGGNSVCVIDARNGSVKTKHYSKDTSEDFRALAWTTVMTVSGPINILAVGGSKSVLHLLHPDQPVCFAEHDLKKSGSKRQYKDSFESLIFHPLQPNILFGAFTSGAVHVWDIGTPHPPEYESNLVTLKSMRTKSPVCDLTYSVHCNMLLCATNTGVVGWSTPLHALGRKENYKEYTFHFYSTNENIAPEDRDIADSIEAIGKGELIATKCALHGFIYIWNLECAMELKSRTVQPLHTLRWSDTDNFYMNIGINKTAHILACGDDKGKLWIYDIQEILKLSSPEHDCTNVIEWPEVQDSQADRKKKLPFGKSDIVVNKVTLNYDASYLVAVTNTNTVCIWKRID